MQLKIVKAEFPALNHTDQVVVLVRTNIGGHCVKRTALVKHVHIVVNQPGSARNALMVTGVAIARISVS